MPPGYSRVSDEEEGPFRFGREATAVAVVDTSRQREMSLRSSGFNRTPFSAISGLFNRVISLYVSLNTRWWAALTVWFLILLVSVGSVLLGWFRFPPKIDVTLDSFQIPEQRVSREYDALLAAGQWSKSYHSRRFARSSSCCSRGQQGCPKWKFNIVYLPIGGGNESDNIFTKERIEDIHNIEMRITQQPDYEKYCWKMKDKCVPINSLMTYFYPSLHDNQHVYDGMGLRLSNVTDRLLKAATSTSMYWYVDSQFDIRLNKRSGLLRSEVIFARPLEDFPNCPTSAQLAKESAVADRYIESLIPMLASASTKNVKVLYGGGTIYDYEVKQAVLSDSKLAIASLCLIVVIVFVLTSFSLYLTLMGILCVVESFPITYIIYRIFFGIPVVGILNVVSLFVIVGIGVDDVFVFINTFRLSQEHGSNIHMRLMYTIKTAGRTTLFTSVTTATAFFANLLSELPAIHDFGLFMGWLVIVCYLVTLLSMPAILYMWWKANFYCNFQFMCKDMLALEQNEQPAERVDRSSTCNGLALPMQLMNGHAQLAVNGDCNVNDADDGAQLAADSGDCVDDDDDPPLILVNDDDARRDFSMTSDGQLLCEQIAQGVCCQDVTDEHLTRVNEQKTCSLFAFLHRFISNHLSRWIIRSRIMIFVLYLIVLCVSCGLLSNLQTAEKPPQFFPSDSNIQELIDIGYNLTNSDESSCLKCSGYFKVGSVTVPTEQPNAQTNYPGVMTTVSPTDSHSHKATSLTVTKHPIITSTNETTHHTAPDQNTELPTEKAKPLEHTTQSPVHLTTKNKLLHPTSYVQTDSSSHVEGTSKHTTIRKATVAHVTQTPPVIPSCSKESSCKTVERPASGNSAIVYVVFGILDIDRSRVTSAGHVLSDDLGDIVWDKQFVGKLGHQGNDAALIYALCDICIQAQDPLRGLVQKNGADCFPKPLDLSSYDDNIQCKDLKSAVNYTIQFSYSGSIKLRAGIGFNGSQVQWISMAFQSTTYMGHSSFDNIKDYDRWNDFLSEMRKKHKDVAAIQNMYQTSHYWVVMFSETISVSSAIYGIVLSSLLCMCWVILFTGHIWLLVVVFMSIAGTLLTVLTLMYLIGWTFGGVEAVTLSILVGTSVDYIVHLVESFVISGKELKVRESNPNRDVQNRVRWAISHVGISIVSSAITTVAASIPLCFTEVQLFAKFGQILLLNTGISIIYALTVCVALLSIFGGLKCCYLRRYHNSCKRGLITFVAVCIVGWSVVLGIFIACKSGGCIPGPDGESLF